MDLETLFTNSKWGILEKIAQKPMSPLQLSTTLNTSPANVSQQIKLLEMAGLLDKERVSTRETGKPRTLFSLKDDFSYLISVSKEGAQKGLIPTDAKKRLILRSWMANDPDLEQIAFDMALIFKDGFKKIGGVAWDPDHRLLFMVIDNKDALNGELESIRESTLQNHHHLQVIDRRRFLSLLDTSDSSDVKNIQILIMDDHLSQILQKKG